MRIVQTTRRQLLTNAAFAGAACLGGLGAWGKSLAAEPPPEVTTIRFGKDTATCIAPQVFQELLRAEGFTEIRYVDVTEALVRRADAANSEVYADMIAHGEIDFGRSFAPSFVLGMNAGAPVMVLSGLHLGCFEIFGKNEIRTLGDLKGRTVGIDVYKNSPNRALLAIMTRLVGLDPAKDIRWVSDPKLQPMDLFAEGKVDAFLASPPDLQEVRARNIGHVIVSSINDRPWSQYLCCMLATRPTETLPANIGLPPSACCAPFSRLPISARPSPNARRDCLSNRDTRRIMTMPCRRCASRCPNRSW